MSDVGDELEPTSKRATREILDVRHGQFHSSGKTPDTSGYNTMTWFVEMPAAARRPFGGWFDEAADRLGELVDFDAAINQVVIHRGELTLVVAADHIVEVCRVLRDDPHLRFELMRSVSGVHYPTDTGAELHVVYHLLSMTHKRALRLEVSVADADPHLPSIVAVYPTADWHEREVWDMFGVVFEGHPSLTRILMPDDWPGHPQRKDYPLGGIPVEFKGATTAPVEQRRNYNS